MRISTKYRWAILICALLLIGFLTSSISSYLVSRSNVRQTISESSLPLTSDNVYSEIQRDLLRPVFISSLMANDTFLKDWAIGDQNDNASITKYLNEIKIKYSTITSFFVSEKTKKYYHAQGILKAIDENDPRDSWYLRVRDMKEPYEINVDMDLANQDEMTIFINYRVINYSGDFIGVSGVGLTVSRVNLLISSYEAKYDRHIYFTDATGKIVLKPSNSSFYRNKNIVKIEHILKELEDMASGRQARLTYREDHKTHMLNCRYVPELKWYLIVEQSEDEMLAPFRIQLVINILIALGITIIVASICIATVRRNQRKLELQNDDLSKTNKEIARQHKEIEKAASELETANKQLSERNKEKDEFIGIVAHDLRNPLNGILGLCELMEPLSEEQLQDIQAIQDSGERMLTLINTLLEVSRIEGFHGKLKSERIEINQLIDQSISYFEKQAKQKHIYIQTEIEQSQNLQISTTPDWFEICLNNLVSNAVKYTPEYGKISIKTARNRDRLTISIIDSGPGISEEDQQKLFGKFVRLTAKPTGGESSTGLGLYVVKNMCNRLGIDILVDSYLGKGTTFSLEFKNHDRN